MGLYLVAVCYNARQENSIYYNTTVPALVQIHKNYEQWLFVIKLPVKAKYNFICNKF